MAEQKLMTFLIIVIGIGERRHAKHFTATRQATPANDFRRKWFCSATYKALSTKMLVK